MSLVDELASIAPRARSLKILTLDIETRPPLSYHWGTFGVNISLNQNVEPGGLMCFGAKWLHEKNVRFYSEWEHGLEGTVAAAHQMLSQADVLCTYNGESFDVPILRWEMARLRLDRPKPYKSVDLLRVVRKEFRPLSKKLDHVASELGLGHKVAHSGFDLWRSVMEGDDKARRLMTRYCKGDVKLTEQLYMRLLPWLPSTVNIPLLAGLDSGCPNCGGDSLERDGSTFAALTEYSLYHCSDCGSWARSNEILHRVSDRLVR